MCVRMCAAKLYIISNSGANFSSKQLRMRRRLINLGIVEFFRESLILLHHAVGKRGDLWA